MKIDPNIPTAELCSKIHSFMWALSASTIPANKHDAFLWRDLWQTRIEEYIAWLDVIILRDKILAKKEQENALRTV